MNFPSEKNDQKKFEKNNVTIALNALQVKKEKAYPGSLPKHNSNYKIQVILLRIPIGEQLWHYLPVKKIISIIKKNSIKK